VTPVAFAPSRPFVPAAGLESPHAQTVFASVARGADPAWERRVLGTPDGDFVELWLAANPGAPLLLLLHGLEGSARSGYITLMARGALERGWSVGALEFRSCGTRSNHTLRGYHSGEWTDPAFVLQRMRASLEPSVVFAAGFSLGGSVLLNLLADGPSGLVDAAAAISVPFDLLACVRAIDAGGGWNDVYLKNFVPTMRQKALRKAAHFPGQLDEEAISRANTIQEIDRHFTARAFGFDDEVDYYLKCSTAPKLSRIGVPTLLISAEDDPLAPASHLPAEVEKNEQLSVVRTEHGGHVGFVEGTVLRPGFWAEEQALGFFDLATGR
jgi:predicted alpha/beta-fold hydrolase